MPVENRPWSGDLDTPRLPVNYNFLKFIIAGHQYPKCTFWVLVGHLIVGITEDSQLDLSLYKNNAAVE